MEAKELKIYTERLKKQYLEMLTYREGILEQTKIEEKRLEELKQKEKEIIARVEDKLKEESMALLKLKSDNSGFTAELEKEKQKLERLASDISEREAKIQKKIDYCDLIKAAQTRELERLETEKRTLAENNLLTKNKEKELDRKLAELEKRVNENADLKQYNKEELERLNERAKELAAKEKELLLKEEAVKKTSEALKTKEDNLNKDRVHLESQSETLRQTFEEARKKNLL